MPIRLIAVDLDGTLLNNNSEISPANRQALVEASERGIQIVIITGRRYHSARPKLESLPCPVTLVTSNGAVVRTLSGELLHQDLLPRKIAIQVLEAAINFRPYAAAIFDKPSRGQVMMQQNASPDGPLRWYQKTAREYLMQVIDLSAALPGDPIQIMFGGTPAFLEPLEHLLRASHAGRHVHLTWTKYFDRDVGLLDVMNLGCSKASGLNWLLEQMDCHASEVMAIGDNYNDLEMLQLAGCPVVMGNCCPGIAGDGWHITHSNDEDGVATAIHSLVLNKQRELA
ncbi:MAG TPA: Cof-type HAD-IIB family hydrolase [Terriglobia bacterium]|nr:Cof-type HAD-IIB family hydrolase [Terriglobia bacterium]